MIGVTEELKDDFNKLDQMIQKEHFPAAEVRQFYMPGADEEEAEDPYCTYLFTLKNDDADTLEWLWDLERDLNFPKNPEDAPVFDAVFRADTVSKRISDEDAGAVYGKLMEDKSYGQNL